MGEGTNMGPTRVGAHPPPRACPGHSWPPRLLLDVHSKSPGLRLFKNNSTEGFIPFDIPFPRNTEIGKKTAICIGPSVNRLVPKII